MGLLCLTSGYDLTHTALGHRICLGLGVFWGIRLFFQFFVYDAQLWRGKTLETIIHILFSGMWMYFTFVFLKIFLTNE